MKLTRRINMYFMKCYTILISPAKFSNKRPKWYHTKIGEKHKAVLVSKLCSDNIIRPSFLIVEVDGDDTIQIPSLVRTVRAKDCMITEEEMLKCTVYVDNFVERMPMFENEKATD